MKHFRIDSANAYYVSHGKLWSVPLEGGEPVALANLPGGACPQGDFVIRGTNIYFTETCGGKVWWVRW